MTRSEYLAELRTRLQRLSAEDVQAAVEFYEEYFEDAGDDAAAVESLDSPARVAAQILAEFSAQALSDKNAAAEMQSGVFALMASMPQTVFPDYLAADADAAAPDNQPAANEAESVQTAPAATQPTERIDEPTQNEPSDPAEPVAPATANTASAVPPAAPHLASGYTRESYHAAPVPPMQNAADGSIPPMAGNGATAYPDAYTHARYTAEVSQPSPYTNPVQSPYTTPQGRQSSLSAIWYVVLGIFALPVALPLALVAIFLIVLLVVLCVAAVVALLGVIISLIVGAVSAVATVFTVGAGAMSVGTAFVLFGLALVLIPLLIWFATWLVRAVGRVSAKLFNKLKARSSNNEKQK